MTTMRLFGHWVTTPTRDGYARLQDSVQAEFHYDATRHLASQIVPVLDDAHYIRAERMLLEVLAAHVLSPAAHALLARCHDGLGEPERAATERKLAELTMQAILHSGDGSEARPYPVLVLSDEYDVLEVLGIKPSIHASKECGGDVIDMFQDGHGHTVHFALRRGGRRARS
ncbi:hypothetical protein [uncultured Tessaracoccus sp.]|uniref:hypothetical protein n=1 Tax=uncultured Tessaracoccus sp. TaxID=905023 RepID=UPI0025DE3A2B|nr:hypothetical protein [uncultured Tessaracoccus sp.]